jgi:hypothetical protein
MSCTAVATRARISPATSTVSSTVRLTSPTRISTVGQVADGRAYQRTMLSSSMTPEATMARTVVS